MFGLNQVQIIGRIGNNVEIRTLSNGGKVANFTVATDEGYRNKQTGEWVDRVEWHRVTTFQPGLVGVLDKHCLKGRLTYVQGKLQTRKWQDNAGNERTTTEILVIPGGRVTFLDKSPNATPQTPTTPAAAPEYADDPGDDIPY